MQHWNRVGLLKNYNLFFFITDHVDKLLDLIFDRVFQDLSPYVDEVMKIPIPEDLSAQFEKPDKLEGIAPRSFLERTECLFASGAPCRRVVQPWFSGPESPNTSLQNFCRPNTCNGWAKFTFREQYMVTHIYSVHGYWWHKQFFCNQCFYYHVCFFIYYL